MPEDGELVVGVEDDEPARQTGLGREAPEEADAEGVERADEGARPPGPEQVRDALLHLPRGLVREGERDERLLGGAVGHEPRHPAGEDARLPRAGAGEDEEGPRAGRDGGGLLRVEAFEEIVVARRSTRDAEDSRPWSARP